MGILVIIFMMGQGYFAAPFIGLAGAVVGCIITTRLMQYFTCKDYPQFRYENALSDEEMASIEEEEKELETKPHQSGFIRVLNALLDGGKSGVEIGNHSRRACHFDFRDDDDLWRISGRCGCNGQ